jgi:hypothetical protein
MACSGSPEYTHHNAESGVAAREGPHRTNPLQLFVAANWLLRERRPSFKKGPSHWCPTPRAVDPVSLTTLRHFLPTQTARGRPNVTRSPACRRRGALLPASIRAGRNDAVPPRGGFGSSVRALVARSISHGIRACHVSWHSRLIGSKGRVSRPSARYRRTSTYYDASGDGGLQRVAPAVLVASGEGGSRSLTVCRGS